ncbi:MAG TPA: DNA alkylation repair protein [Pseudoxanthomonas sp.]|nr:DNA alkylation repair protein [Pseudoxanthomonas sp.]
MPDPLTAPPDDIRRQLHALADPAVAAGMQRFFKTGPGEYGEGDRFLGIRVPALRRLARAHRALPLDAVLELLRSEWHEARLLALLVLVEQHRRGDGRARAAIHRAYLAHARHVDNWDLVDASAVDLVGPHVDPGDPVLLVRLAGSGSVWERRIAVIATFHWIRRGEFGPALRIAEQLLHDPHDLIHKAVGWMLREVGNRDRTREEAFLASRYHGMPRTMLRYAVERFPEARRRQYLEGRA